MKTGIIIPCHNEEKKMNAQAFISFIKNNSDYHLCFVNDGSRDNTLELLYDMKRRAPHNISIIDVKKTSGKAIAVRAGIRFLYNMKTINYIGFIDADLSINLEDFKKLVKTLKIDDSVSVVYTSFNTKDNDIIQCDLFGGIVAKCIKYGVHQLLKIPICNTFYGAKVFRKSIIPIICGEAFVCRYLFQVEMFLRLKNYIGRKGVMSKVLERPSINNNEIDCLKLKYYTTLITIARIVRVWYIYSFNNSEIFASKPYNVALDLENEDGQLSILI